MKKKLFWVHVDSNLRTLQCIDPHESQTVFYYCNTAETVYDGTVELSFTLFYSHSGQFIYVLFTLYVSGKFYEIFFFGKNVTAQLSFVLIFELIIICVQIYIIIFKSCVLDSQYLDIFLVDIAVSFAILFAQDMKKTKLSDANDIN